MSGESVTSVDEARTTGEGVKETRGRSKVGFPYNDLDSVMTLVNAIHSQVGTGACDDDQLAAWTTQSPKSSGYRSQLSAARMFGVIETASGRHKLAPLGRRIVDPAQVRAARSEAFMKVPLFKAVFEKYRGGVIPPAAALERDIVSIGVADKTKDRARRVLERAAEQAGFFEQGRDRLVMPGIAPNGNNPPPPGDQENNRGGGGDGGTGGFAGLHPFIQGLLTKLPEPDSEWAIDDRLKWLQTAANIFDLMYEGEGGIDVRPAHAQRSPRPDNTH